jgi:hypothetical protein
VLRPGGVLAAAAISRYASTCDGLLRGYLDEPGFEAIVERVLRDGQHRNPTGRPEWFTTAYFHLPEELAQEVTEAGLRLHALLAVEGPAWMLPDIQRRLADPARRERVLAAIRRIETEPSLLGASSICSLSPATDPAGGPGRSRGCRSTPAASFGFISYALPFRPAMAATVSDPLRTPLRWRAPAVVPPLEEPAICPAPLPYRRGR